MQEIYGVHSFNTYTYLFTKKRQLKEKHLFILSTVFFLYPVKIKFGQR